MILEECFGSSLSDNSKTKRSNNTKTSCSSSSSNPKSYRAQLEQSKQVIQMLFNDLKTSKQNEALLSDKLRATHVALRQERNRSRENTRIAMRSADEVRANLASKNDALPPYSAAAEVDRLRRELGQAREECLKWKQMAHRQPETPDTMESDVLYAPTDEERVVTPSKRDRIKSRSAIGRPKTPKKNVQTPTAPMDAPPAMVVCTPKASRQAKKDQPTAAADSQAPDGQQSHEGTPGLQGTIAIGRSETPFVGQCPGTFELSGANCAL